MARAHLTLTGADRFMPVHDMQALLDSGPVELAFLVSQEATGPRFVDVDWLRRALPQLRGALALHVCGPGARRQLQGGELDALMPWLARVQVNGVVTLEQLPGLLRRVPTLITQHHAANAPLATAEVGTEAHALLVDDSSGLGRLPKAWQRPAVAKAVGFAGGLSPDNLAQQWPALVAAASPAAGPWWLDMESSLRDGADRFDLVRARQAVARFVALA